MKILLIGSGGREHALAWKLAQSPKVSKLFCAPGNAGTAQIADNVAINADDIPSLLNFAKQEKIDLTMVGPEAPLVLGIVDEFEKAGLKIFGPNKAAAILEGSKVFSKELMKKYGIPSAKFEAFKDASAAKAYAKKLGAPCVVKADGLAAGKGVIICQTVADAEHAIDRILKDKEFGQAGNELIVEEFLEGEEASILAFTDGKTVIPMVTSQDHKRVNDNDEGPNTGGMGAYSPAPVVTPELMKKIEKDVLQATVDAMAKEGRPYKGVLYAGLMLTKDGPKVLEYNCRFGDPETQVVIPRMKTDLFEVLWSLQPIEWDARPAVCIVLAAGGYPGKYEKDIPIEGLESAREEDDVIVFHAGTKEKDGKIVTAGGRVLGVVGLGDDIKGAIDRAYTAVELIHFKDMHYRKDIGKRALK